MPSAFVIHMVDDVNMNTTDQELKINVITPEQTTNLRLCVMRHFS